MRYGDFESLCARSPLPICRVFGQVAHLGCLLKSYSIRDSQLVNIADFVVSIAAFLVTVALGFRAHKKLAAVGFQYLPDGSFASILTIVVTSAIVFVGIGYIAADTAFGISGGLKPSPKDPFYSPGLFTVYVVFPLVAVVIYIITQSIIVFKFLAVRLPLAWLLASLISFALAQVFVFAVSKSICTGTSRKIDGAFFGTLFNSAAVFGIYGFWSSITEDDSETYAGTYKL
ncbi:hypothetical protein GGI12_004156 [Dipsacomyces acuminosporus]|nr:hypothetical protein GGI12_004156 [Dipsacomyces acuminosporus]